MCLCEGKPNGLETIGWHAACCGSFVVDDLFDDETGGCFEALLVDDDPVASGQIGGFEGGGVRADEGVDGGGGGVGEVVGSFGEGGERGVDGWVSG